MYPSIAFDLLVLHLLFPSASLSVCVVMWPPSFPFLFQSLWHPPTHIIVLISCIFFEALLFDQDTPPSQFYLPPWCKRIHCFCFSSGAPPAPPPFPSSTFFRCGEARWGVDNIQEWVLWQWMPEYQHWVSNDPQKSPKLQRPLSGDGALHSFQLQQNDHKLRNERLQSSSCSSSQWYCSSIWRILAFYDVFDR